MSEYTRISNERRGIMTYVVDGYEIDQIKIFKDGEVLFESRSGWLEAFVGNVENSVLYVDKSDFMNFGSGGAIDPLYIKGEVRRANKVTDKHLRRKDSFHVTEKDNNRFRPNKRVLYISAYALEDVATVGEAIVFETSREIHYKDVVWVEVMTDNGIKSTYLTSGETYKRTVLKTYGSAINIVQGALEQCGVTVTSIEAEKLLNNADYLARVLSGAASVIQQKIDWETFFLEDQ